MLVEAAARRRKVDANACRAENGEVIHAASGRKLAYGDLVSDASQLVPPKDPPLKAPADFRTIGKPLKRLDTPDKVNGRAIYGIDAMPPGREVCDIRPVLGPMAQAVDLSFEKMTPSDIRAIVTYLRSVPAVAAFDLPASKAEPAPANPKHGVVAEIDPPRGKQVFEGACASCHAWTGVSLLDSRATLTGGRAVNDPTAINVAQIVLPAAGASPPMAVK
jgi:hypothetical protein